MMSETQDFGELNKPLPDPGPRDGKHGEGDNWGYNEQGQSANSPDDTPRRRAAKRAAIEETDRDRSERHD
ncbi:MAG: hypothetical protein JWN09_1316 [Microbacteriaceae bacterium]|nr:hypothetical protein [Microbacteriaceae bacterium]